MIRIFYRLVLGMMFLLSSFDNLSAQQMINIKKMLGQKYNLVPQHSKDTQYYEMESKLQKHALDGAIQETDIYRLYVRCLPSATSSKGDEYLREIYVSNK